MDKLRILCVCDKKYRVTEFNKDGSGERQEVGNEDRRKRKLLEARRETITIVWKCEEESRFRVREKHREGVQKLWWVFFACKSQFYSPPEFWPHSGDWCVIVISQSS